MIGAEIVTDKQTKKHGKEEAKEIMLRCWKRGVAIITSGASSLRVAPPLTITAELMDSGLDIVEDVIKEVEKEH